MTSLLLRADEAFLHSIGSRLGLLRGVGVLRRRDAFSFLMDERVSPQAEWSYTGEACSEALQLCREAGLLPPVPTKPTSTSAYRRRLKKLLTVEEEKNLLWVALGFHVARHTQFVSVAEPLALTYMRGRELVLRAKREFAEEEVAAIEAGEGLVTLELALTYLTDRIEGLASTGAALTVEKGDATHEAVERVVDAMEEHLAMLEADRRQLTAARVQDHSLEYSAADEHMVNLLRRQPYLGSWRA